MTVAMAVLLRGWALIAIVTCGEPSKQKQNLSATQNVWPSRLCGELWRSRELRRLTVTVAGQAVSIFIVSMPVVFFRVSSVGVTVAVAMAVAVRA